jgi:hypothetical protein
MLDNYANSSAEALGRVLYLARPVADGSPNVIEDHIRRSTDL